MKLPRSRVTSIAVCAALVIPGVASAARADASPQPVTVIIDASHPGRTIPSDFLGLSFEANQLHRTWTDPGRGNVARLLRNLGAGNLRFSANQVDNSAWLPDPSQPTPRWATAGQKIVPDDLSRLGRLAEATGWSVDLGVNLGHFDPAAAASEAAAATRRIGSHLRSIQIGNEPNIYQLTAVSGTRRPYTPQSYVRDATIYRKAIQTAAPGVHVEGPDTAGGALGIPAVDDAAWQVGEAPWLDAYLAAFGSRSRYLNQHYYPYVNVTRVGAPAGAADAVGALPTVDRLLAPGTRAKQTKFLRQFAVKARRGGLKALLSETNSVAKEGREGVTNSFGAALWTVDYLMTAAREGIAGVNLHNQVDDCQSYPLFCFADDAARQHDSARVNPNYYGALLVSSMVGGAVLPVTVDAGGAGLTAFAVRKPDGTISVIVDNLDRKFRGTVTVKIDGGAASRASVARLVAPSPDALTGTSFAGARVEPDGSVTARSVEHESPDGGRYRVRLDKPSAILLTAR